MKIKYLIVGALTVAILAGCGSSVDKNKLAQLTGDKNFAQIKQSYQIAVANENKGDQKVYEYWLKNNGAKADPTFSADLFEKNIKMKLKETKEQIDKQIADMKKHKAQITYYQLSDELQSAEFLAPSVKYIRDVYIPFLEKLKKEKAQK